MELIALEKQRVERLFRRYEKLRSIFKDFYDSLGGLSHHEFPVSGIAATYNEAEDKVCIVYRNIAVDLVLTMTQGNPSWDGRVSAILTKHPLIQKPVQLDSFTFNHDGRTSMAGTDGFGSAAYITGAALDIVLTVMETAIPYTPS